MGKVSAANKRATAKYRREKMVGITFRLSKIYDQDLIDVYQSIPNKMDWFKKCLREYGEKHPK